MQAVGFYAELHGTVALLMVNARFVCVCVCVCVHMCVCVCAPIYVCVCVMANIDLKLISDVDPIVTKKLLYTFHWN